jgi:hypothetical protein
MNGAGYIIVSWTLMLGAVLLYAAYLIHRGRTLSSHVPVHRRRWLRARARQPE